MRRVFNKENLLIIFSLALFNFVFLCEEYIFDGVMSDLTTEQGVVNAQNIILGASVIGFLGVPVFARFMEKIGKYATTLIVFILCGVCMFIIYGHPGYGITLVAGIVEYILLGLAGSCSCYLATQIINDRKFMARVVGMSYALGVFVQFLNNNLVKQALLQIIVMMSALGILVVLLLMMYGDLAEKVTEDEVRIRINSPVFGVVMLAASVVLMTCIFSTLDNAVTLVHASGSFDIGQWPRLILALSGLTAGILYDLFDRRYMSQMMYGITLVAALCIVVLIMGGPFVVGLIMFYISAGFFVVFFMTSFMDLSLELKWSSMFAGMGRAINNLCAIITTGLSVKLLSSDSKMLIIIVAIILFAAINATLIPYSMQVLGLVRKDEEDVSTGDMPRPADANDTTKCLEQFAEYFGFTKRETEVLEALLHSDGNVQTIASQLAISRAALYRHISSMNEKTNTQNRVALLKFYYSWEV